MRIEKDSARFYTRRIATSALKATAYLGRRGALRMGFAAILLLIARRARAEGETPRENMRPQPGDQLVFLSGPNEGKLVRPEDLPLGGPQDQAFPKDPATGTVRDGSPLNLLVVARFDPALLSEETVARAADGVVAYSGVCTHENCPVSMWKEEEKLLFCSCHGSEYDPRNSAAVVGGPAPRRLAALPVKLVDGIVTVAAPFTGGVGARR
jgi:rieske iron-sulfur protein